METTTFPDTFVIGYGSLMSGQGLHSLGPLQVRDAAAVRLHNARRGFAQLSQHGNHFAMVLDAIDQHQPITATRVTHASETTDAPEGLMLHVNAEVLARICTREGYRPSAMHNILQMALQRGCDVGTVLWDILDSVGYDPVAYREQLFALTNYTSPHYIPHPVRITSDCHAITFLAPGEEGCGVSHVIPMRIRRGSTVLLSASEAWRQKPHASQLRYFTVCLLAGLHGVYVGDLLPSILDQSQDADSLYQRIREALHRTRDAELDHFLATTGIAQDIYSQQFSPATTALQRSQLTTVLD